MTSPLSTKNPTTGGLVYEYLSTLYPPNHDVMQDTRRVKAGFSWHGVYFPFRFPLLTYFFTGLPPFPRRYNYPASQELAGGEV